MKVKSRISGIIIAAIFFFLGFLAHGYLPQDDVKCPENSRTDAKNVVIEDSQMNDSFTNTLIIGNMSGFPMH